jgi:hypothetical protein
MRLRLPSASVRGWLAAGLACALAAAAASTARAGLVGGLVNTLLSPCSGQLTKPFEPWGDHATYALAPDGGFEAGASGWALTSGAHVVAGNETFSVRSSTDSFSLALPDGSVATTPSTCIGTLSPTLRFFARNDGSPLARLRVDVLYRDALGLSWSVPIATVSGDGSWQPTAPALVLANVTALPVLTGGAARVSFRFTALGTGGDWSIDDVYVDPYEGS